MDFSASVQSDLDTMAKKEDPVQESFNKNITKKWYSKF